MESSPIRRVGIIFAGGPAPAANAVISAAAISFLDEGCEVIGFFHGYSSLASYRGGGADELRPDEHYRVFRERDVGALRNRPGIVIGTSRTNPGKGIESPEDLHCDEKTEGLRATYEALIDLKIDALISIGGDDTLKTANLLHLYQRSLPSGANRVRIVHLPKTIDNDYRGIDFTFGFFTAVEVMAQEVRNLRADAVATGSWFLVETMGRKAGWLSYGVAIAGEANLVIGVEDLDEEICPSRPGQDGSLHRELDLQRLADRIVDLICVREERDKKRYGVVVLAEGLAEFLPDSLLADIARDDHGHLSLGKLDLGKLLAQIVAARYQERRGSEKKVKGLQMGYESRCAPAHAFDIVLGSQLGVGAFRALVEEGLDGHMVSVEGQFDLRYVPFDALIDGGTLRTQVRLIEAGSDFHRLARFLETRTDRLPYWSVEEGAGAEPS